MMKKVLLSLIFAGILSFISNAADLGGKLHVEDVLIASGETAVLPIYFDNDVDVNGLHFQTLLPSLSLQPCHWAHNSLSFATSTFAPHMVTTSLFL